MNRNPDFDIDSKEPLPEACYLHEGKLLMGTARAAKIPYGLAFQKGKWGGPATVGLIIRCEDQARMLEALERKRLANERKGLIKR